MASGSVLVSNARETLAAWAETLVALDIFALFYARFNHPEFVIPLADSGDEEAHVALAGGPDQTLIAVYERVASEAIYGNVSRSFARLFTPPRPEPAEAARRPLRLKVENAFRSNKVLKMASIVAAVGVVVLPLVACERMRSPTRPSTPPMLAEGP